MDNNYLDTLDPLKRSESSCTQVIADNTGTGMRGQQNKVMSEMRRHLVKMNRDKMIERGTITAKELAILGKYSSFTDMATATMDFSSETVNSSTSSTSSNGAAAQLWRELLY